uniref:Uncharacterized protein n=1 Tax=Chromera velia CCMP2878 TaxID=1169474 RepID=A0A0G4HIX1_9ALVE|eukprot:Cvel_27993.t1-p1 / transcript=Cvel_27993.t1 / gene=Cvel_27993 / organism=Chromera_velia_CCMP2878 / gene_product=hypothetical protein / transcript_product=hypothetical protein / location=Cvel_scaffold3586:10619-12712(-) / protein_length=96 / sequence_SO=supercontig / SO=protein_coding / is_pseudo=false
MTIDGSNDRTSKSNVIVFVEFLHPKSFEWVVEFWELSGVEGQSTRYVKDSFLASLQRHGVDMKRLCPAALGPVPGLHQDDVAACDLHQIFEDLSSV